jgi:transcriptional regulator with XRE-family HTH domain
MSTVAAPRDEPPATEEDAASALGPAIRCLRQEKGLTLAQLAERSGLSIGHLSQVERSLSTPTIRQLQAIGAAMGVRIGWFFREPEATPSDPGRVVVRAAERKTLRYDGLGMTDFLLTPGLEGRIELILAELEPGAASGDEPYSHEGEEAGLVVEGELELWVDEERHLLRAGDSFAFASTRPHRYRNPGRATARVVWAVTPPSY